MAYSFGYGGYNPLQNRMDSLMQQRQMIDQQMQSLQQMNVPPININNNMTPQIPTNYDGNFKWVDNEEQAKQIANNNLPLILFDNNEPKFYMKNVDGSFKSFSFQEIQPKKEEDSVNIRMDVLENKLNDLLGALGVNSTQDDIVTPPEDKTPRTGSKQLKGGSQK